MNWLEIFKALLPSLILAMGQVGTALAGHQKKAAVEAGLTSIAQTISAVTPQHAAAATDAAKAAIAAIDGTVQVLKDEGKLKP